MKICNFIFVFVILSNITANADIVSFDPQVKERIKVSSDINIDDHILFELCDGEGQCSLLGDRSYTRMELMNLRNQQYIEGVAVSGSVFLVLASAIYAAGTAAIVGSGLANTKLAALMRLTGDDILVFGGGIVGSAAVIVPFSRKVKDLFNKVIDDFKTGWRFRNRALSTVVDITLPEGVNIEEHAEVMHILLLEIR